MIKLIVSDMDGTLLDENMEISYANVSAIKRAQSQGIHFAIATGRDFPMAYPLLEDNGISCPVIAQNGAQYFDEDSNVKYNRGLEKSTVRKMLDIFSGYEDIHEELMTSKGIYSDNKDHRLEMLAMMLYDMNPDTSYEEALENAAEYAKELKIHFVDDYVEIINDDSAIILKVSVHSSKGREILDPLKEELQREIPILAITASSKRNLEINHEAAQKGIAVAQLAKQLGVKAEEVMTVGDNINDLSMLEWAKYSVAVENAEPEAKAAARFLTSSNRQNGVAEAISRVLSDKFYNQ
ncbi:Cof-type HAD-IIB family hydrolase [Alkalibacterium kapii]|uniref:Haloacid dehalogenase n=1 Tax=Alkalibacterium kapii TaxID=426704 RepID=A0A511AUN3_9LACT|nr:Cof-type HAD-IIB family hydrolase [Alkalibacterium kapii]GEK91905.1 haloacid dehalogenase [Alkalibacterium kapii]